MVAVATSTTISRRKHERAGARRNRILSLLDIGVLLAALLVFALFLVLLIRIVFPVGSRLGDMGPGGESHAPAGAERGELSIAGDAFDGIGNFIALLADVRREVKIRPADSIAWSDASAGVSVGNRDAVQTFADSRARVDFSSDNELRIGQNSLVIFRSGSADPFLQRRDPAVVVLEGELTGEINADYGSFAVELPVGLVVMKSDGTEGDTVDFKLTINPDKSSTVAIYSGQADVSIAGVKYRVSANEGLTIREDGATSGVRALPALPTVRLPRARALAKFRDTRPRVVFQWGEVPGAQNYRLELAKDASFEEILVDEYLTDAAFTHGNLAEGKYFWRVSARSGWVQGPASRPRSLRIVRDTTPPELVVEPIEQVVAGGYQLRGRTSPDATVYIRGEVVETSASGEFEYLFEAKPGASPIVVEAIDALGNVTYESQILYFRNNTRRSD